MKYDDFNYEFVDYIPERIKGIKELRKMMKKAQSLDELE